MTTPPTTVGPRTSGTARPRRSRLAGAGRMIGMTLRRDRVVLPLWGLFVVLTVLGAANSAPATYPDQAAVRARFDQVHEMPMFLMFQSRPFAATIEGLVAQQAFGGATIFASIGAALLLVRHTRSEEQAGRTELVRAGAVGHAAPLTAAGVVLFGAGALIGLLSAGGLVALGLPADGSALLGAVVTGATWVGATVGALCAQLTRSARTAGVGALAICYLLHVTRGLGHVIGAPWLTWLTPSGWLEGARPYAGERWWTLALVAAWIAVVLAAAFALSARRDLGSGLLPERAGRATAPTWLTGVATMAWRRHRGAFAVWAAVTALLGVTFGAGGAAAVEDYAGSAATAGFAEGLGIDDPAQVFFVYVVFLYVFVAAIYAILTVLSMRTEETTGVAELLLASPVGRTRWAAATVTAALAGSAALLALMGACLTVTAPGIPGLAAMTLSLVPPVWVYIGVVTAVFGLAPRATVPVAWAALAVGVVGEILVKSGLPDWVYVALSPVASANPYYATPWSWPGLLALAAVLVTAGLVGIRRRDLPR